MLFAAFFFCLNLPEFTKKYEKNLPGTCQHLQKCPGFKRVFLLGNNGKKGGGKMKRKIILSTLLLVLIMALSGQAGKFDGTPPFPAVKKFCGNRQVFYTDRNAAIQRVYAEGCNRAFEEAMGGGWYLVWGHKTLRGESAQGKNE